VSTPLPDSLLGPLLERAAVGIAVLDEEGRYLYVNQRLAEVNGVEREQHIGRTIREVIPHIAESVEALHTDVLRRGAPIRDVQIKGSTLGAPNSSWVVSYLPMEFESRPAVGVVLTDTTERDRAAAEAQRRVRQHAAVADLGQRALAGVEMRELTAAAAAAVTTELEADRAGILEFADDQSHLVMRAGAGWPGDLVGKAAVDLGRRSQAGYSLLTGDPVLSNDLEREERFEVSELIRSDGLRSSINTPIAGAGEPWGVLGVFSHDVDHFDQDDASFVRAVANVLGAAAVREAQARELEEMSGQRGRLVAQTLEAGEREHRQIADALHDDVLQHLLFARQELADAGEGDAAMRARESVEEAAAKLRRVVAGLHPVTLAHAGLAAALESMAREYEARAGLRIDVRVGRGATGHQERLVVTLVRELLENVSKHAGANRALVSVTAEEGELEVMVADDGRGMPLDAIETALARGHIGLATTRERVEALGGTAAVCPGLEQRGTGIRIRIPL
jgi:PAS domain S-box-containing protein